jgi:hypothetical protein
VVSLNGGWTADPERNKAGEGVVGFVNVTDYRARATIVRFSSRET